MILCLVPASSDSAVGTSMSVYAGHIQYIHPRVCPYVHKYVKSGYSRFWTAISTGRRQEKPPLPVACCRLPGSVGQCNSPPHEGLPWAPSPAATAPSLPWLSKQAIERDSRQGGWRPKKPLPKKRVAVNTAPPPPRGRATTPRPAANQQHQYHTTTIHYHYQRRQPPTTTTHKADPFARLFACLPARPHCINALCRVVRDPTWSILVFTGPALPTSSFSSWPSLVVPAL